jgi:hypothetical protein
MGCGCGGSSSSGCGVSKNTLRSIRTRLTTLFNTTKDQDKKTNYRSLLNDLDVIVRDKQNCPNKEVVKTITTFVNNEYTKYIK